MSGARFLLDTNYVIGLVKQQETVIKVITDRAIETRSCAYSCVTRIELLGFPEKSSSILLLKNVAFQQFSSATDY
ncbi:hypothetical protein [Egbenema bharatensis]|uniref:hypothetical protein n=1 Tax=Egbenema bharatensis TaxID=3463334 RepID=UPI003A8C595B